jgi:hypothetical protein
MSHLTLTDLEKQLARITLLADPTIQYAYVETGRYKPFMPATVAAAKRKGYRVERAGGSGSAFYVFPKDSPAQVALGK